MNADIHSTWIHMNRNEYIHTQRENFKNQYNTKPNKMAAYRGHKVK